MALASNTSPTPIDQTIDIFEGGIFYTNLIAGINDPNGDALAMRLITIGNLSNQNLFASNPYKFNADGSFTYYAGYLDVPFDQINTDIFYYQVYDGLTSSSSLGTLTINVRGITEHTAPQDDRIATAGQATTLTGLLDNDNLILNTANIQSLQNAVPGGEAVTQAGGSIKFAPDDQTNTNLIYTPTAGFVGIDSFTYVAQHEIEGVPLTQSSVTVYIRVLPPLNTPIIQPIGASDSYVVSPGALKIVSALNGVLANDNPNGGDLLRANLVSGPTKGVLDFNVDGSFHFNPNGEFNTLETGASETVSFAYAAFNGRGLQSGTTQVNITVTQDGYPAPPLNFAPITKGDTLFLSENETKSVNVLNNDSDPNGDSLTVVFTGPNNANNPFTVSANGTLTYDARFVDIAAGNILIDTFTYTVFDGLSSTVGHLNVNVFGLSATHLAADDFRSVLDGEPQVFSGLLGNDTPTAELSPGTQFFINTLAGGAPGSSATTSAGGIVRFQEAGSVSNTNLIYTPPPGFSGIDSFTY